MLCWLFFSSLFFFINNRFGFCVVLFVAFSFWNKSDLLVPYYVWNTLLAFDRLQLKYLRVLKHWSFLCIWESFQSGQYFKLWNKWVLGDSFIRYYFFCNVYMHIYIYIHAILVCIGLGENFVLYVLFYNAYLLFIYSFV